MEKVDVGRGGWEIAIQRRARLAYTHLDSECRSRSHERKVVSH